jgi:hypothetical protein
MPLRIDTFRNDIGGSSIYKAISHPLAAEPARALLAKLGANGRTAIYDPDGIIEAFETFYPLTGIELAGYFVQNIEHLNRRFRNLSARAVTDLANTQCGTVLIASFDDKKPLAQIRHLLPRNAQTISFAHLKTPAELQTVPDRYLSTLNFATNHVFFRDEDGHHTRLVTANYWTRYGAKAVSLWCRLFAADGSVLATWTESCGAPESSVVIDSREIRERFELPPSPANCSCMPWVSRAMTSSNTRSTPMATNPMFFPPRMTRIPGRRSLCRPACPRRRRRRDPLGAEQPSDFDSGRRYRHGRDGPRGRDAPSGRDCALRHAAAERFGIAAGLALARSDRNSRRQASRAPAL